MNCEKATRLMEMAQEKKLSFGQRLQLLFHTALCKPCALFKKQSTLLLNKAKHSHEFHKAVLSAEDKKKLEKKLKDSL